MNGPENVNFAKDLIEALAEHGRALQLSARYSWASPNEPDRHSLIVCSGLVALFREDGSGGRRLVALRYPGEVVSPHEHAFAVGAVLPTEIVATDSSSFMNAIQNDSRIHEAFENSLKRSQVIAYEWLMRAALDTPSRVAHFLCEHKARLGLADDQELPLEITQLQLAEFTSQTAVNINRVLRSFAEQGLLMPTGRRTFKADWTELRRLGRFDGSYLA